MALGVLRIKPWHLNRWHFDDMLNAYIGHREEAQNNMIEHWRQTRLIITYIHNFAGRMAKSTQPPERIFKLPGDSKATHISAAQLKKMAQKALRKK
jgi:hypothetical protein